MRVFIVKLVLNVNNIFFYHAGDMICFTVNSLKYAINITLGSKKFQQKAITRKTNVIHHIKEARALRTFPVYRKYAKFFFIELLIPNIHEY